MVKLLLDWGADPFIESSGQDRVRSKKMTAISIARELGREIIFLMLEKAIEAQGDIAKKDSVARRHIRNDSARQLTKCKCAEKDCNSETFRFDLFRHHMNVWRKEDPRLA
jgi:hypothetical protein